VTEVIQAKEIKPRLEILLAEADVVNADLASRLRQISRWLKDTKPGSLTKKRELMFFLRELIEDVEIWLALEELEPVDKQSALSELTPTERYWFTFLFPTWLTQYDPNFDIWKKKLMAGEFEATDRPFLNLLSEQIQKSLGSVLLRYICDLSMATDLIISSSDSKLLCVQLTISDDRLTSDKKEDWLNTVQRWRIQRALFLSYNPRRKTGSQLDVITEVGNYLLEECDSLPDSCYIEYSLS